MDPLSPAALKAQQTYDLAADCFDAGPLEFWARYGRRTVDRLGLRPGARVLDVACGTGASALPAAHAVGPTGHVIGVDLAERLLVLAQEKAARQKLVNLEFRQGDMTRLEYPDGAFDAVVCVFGIFFDPDMTSLVRELWRMVARGGMFAVTTWGPRIFSPAYEVWNEEVRRIRPDLYAAFNPWDRITTPEAVAALFTAAGIGRVRVEAEDGHQPLDGPEDFWTIARGSGLRWTIEQLGRDDARRVKDAVVARLAGVDRVETNVIYAVAPRAG